MTIPRLLAACALMSVSACAGRYRSELVGQGTAFVQPRGVAAGPAAPDPAAPFTLPASGIQLPRGSYDLALWFDVPRAQTIEWTLSCAGATVNGSVGESFEQYRARRVAELRVQRDRERHQVASATSAVVGAVAPAVQTTGYVETPGVTVGAQAQIGPYAVGGYAQGPAVRVPVQAEAQVDANAVGAVVAGTAIEDDIQLPPGDWGQGRLHSTVHVETAADGVCAVTAATDDPNVIGRYEVRRIRDLDAEARLRIMASTSHAVDVRKRVVASLVVSGASPEVRERRLAAAAELRAQAEARLHAEADARAVVSYEVHAQADARVRAVLGIAYQARQQYVAYLVGECHADPNRRARIAQEREAQEQLRIEARAKIDRELRDREQIRIDIALRARMALTASLLAIGAVERPPMPELIAEDPGAVPFDGAHWTAGKWSWTGGRWVWIRGGWSDPDVFTNTGGSLGVSVGGGWSIGIGSSGSSRSDDDGAPSHYGTRDHRSDRDHRSSDTPTYDPPTRSEPVVRDHRSDSASSSSTSRDHRSSKDDDDKKDDSKKDEPKVRDHRR